MTKTITLICEHDGHEWERVSQRGRRPRFCPEHTPDESTPARAIKTDKYEDRANELEEIALEVGYHTAEVLRYVANRLRGPITDADARDLLYSAKRHISQSGYRGTIQADVEEV